MPTLCLNSYAVTEQLITFLNKEVSARSLKSISWHEHWVPIDKVRVLICVHTLCDYTCTVYVWEFIEEQHRPWKIPVWSIVGRHEMAPVLLIQMVREVSGGLILEIGRAKRRGNGTKQVWMLRKRAHFPVWWRATGLKQFWTLRITVRFFLLWKFIQRWPR